MKSNYNKLGEYIREVNNRNRELRVSLLLGVSISKEFIPSIANTIGTDFSNYKIVKNGQFAYGPVTSRNGDKISIALLRENECIISSSYTVFVGITPFASLQKMQSSFFIILYPSKITRFMKTQEPGQVRTVF